jgi:mono/diheme cytochrome c family protein
MRSNLMAPAVLAWLAVAIGCGQSEEERVSQVAPGLRTMTNAIETYYVDQSGTYAGQSTATPTPSAAASPVVTFTLATPGATPATAADGAIEAAQLAHMEQIREQLRQRLGPGYGDPVSRVGAEQLALGEQIFMNRCATCHGDEGKGDGPMGAALNPRPANLSNRAEATFYSDAGMVEIIVNGVPGNMMMPQFGLQLSEQEILAVFNHVRKLRGDR